ncbi:ATP-binding cassette domain-containing protein [bacterium]|nr:ATP-binding cassette domain-containing protein [bacterium]
MNNTTPILRMKNIHKSYPGVQALKNVNFEVNVAEAHALVGENGAGKSTLMKILAGAETKDAGEIHLHDRCLDSFSPRMAREVGISMIYQEFNLVPQLSVMENIFLGREPAKWGFVDFKSQKQKALSILEPLGIELDVTLPVNQLSVAQQQMVEIAKALSFNANIIAMDEPSATLTQYELDNLFRLIGTLKKQNVSVIYISHRLEEIFEICDRLTVLRDGEWVGTSRVEDMDREGIIEMMVGRKIADEFPKERFAAGQPILRLDHVSRGFVREVSFSVRKGEIVGLTGLVGAGRTELAAMIFGADQPEQGTIYLDEIPVCFKSPRQAIDAGICLLTEDRKNQGLILGMKIRENITLPSLSDFSRYSFVLRKKEIESVRQSMRELTIKAPSPDTVARNLSGGNQQKVVLAKWLLSQAKLFIFDEPTRGIDVGAKREIYLLMNELLRRGAGILMISSELPEILGMADRILIMSEGRLAGELNAQEATQEKIMDLATSTIKREAEVSH